MIKVGDMVKLIKTRCAHCECCKEASSGYFEVLPGSEITLDLPTSGICQFDPIDCQFEIYVPDLENK